MDTLTPKQRSERMSLVSHKDTGPELIVRRIVYSLGYRYRLHVRSLPGTPDLVFTKRRKIIFIHGCFWHRHPRCGRLPKSNKRFWLDKLEQNRKRDLSNLRKLRRNGWKVLVIWECQLSTLLAADKIISFLGEK
ncbi:MAG TPA: very short patch repair endonuclease [Candidatus Angelobacter sp.]|nr:very short patch repair endonuclease [Candidatus Angelobacter sp.]